MLFTTTIPVGKVKLAIRIQQGMFKLKRQRLEFISDPFAILDPTTTTVNLEEEFSTLMKPILPFSGDRRPSYTLSSRISFEQLIRNGCMEAFFRALAYHFSNHRVCNFMQGLVKQAGGRMPLVKYICRKKRNQMLKRIHSKNSVLEDYEAILAFIVTARLRDEKQVMALLSKNQIPSSAVDFVIKLLIARDDVETLGTVLANFSNRKLRYASHLVDAIASNRLNIVSLLAQNRVGIDYDHNLAAYSSLAANNTKMWSIFLSECEHTKLFSNVVGWCVIHKRWGLVQTLVSASVAQANMDDQIDFHTVWNAEEDDYVNWHWVNSNLEKLYGKSLSDWISEMLVDRFYSSRSFDEPVGALLKLPEYKDLVRKLAENLVKSMDYFALETFVNKLGPWFAQELLKYALYESNGEAARFAVRLGANFAAENAADLSYYIYTLGDAELLKLAHQSIPRDLFYGNIVNTATLRQEDAVAIKILEEYDDIDYFSVADDLLEWTLCHNQIEIFDKFLPRIAVQSILGKESYLVELCGRNPSMWNRFIEECRQSNVPLMLPYELMIKAAIESNDMYKTINKQSMQYVKKEHLSNVLDYAAEYNAWRVFDRILSSGLDFGFPLSEHAICAIVVQYITGNDGQVELMKHLMSKVHAIFGLTQESMFETAITSPKLKPYPKLVERIMKGNPIPMSYNKHQYGRVTSSSAGNSRTTSCRPYPLPKKRTGLENE
jgi:hypothetical protein